MASYFLFPLIDDGWIAPNGWDRRWQAKLPLKILLKAVRFDNPATANPDHDVRKNIPANNEP